MHRFARLVGRLLLCALFFGYCGAVSGRPQSSANSKLTGPAKQGRALYRRYCIGCHGINGDGEGENAAYLDVKPRDFTAGVFKCRSTPTGSIPTDGDLFDTIGRGINTTAMPRWSSLTVEQRLDLVAYIKTFSSRFSEEKPDPPIPIPAPTPDTAESVLRGRQIFVDLACWQCHGRTGKGNGPSASTLRDNKENPIVPYNFVSGARFKCGASDRDLYRIFMTGLDGTPMPSFQDSLTAEKAWDLVHYLQTIRQNSGKNSESIAAAGSETYPGAEAPPPAAHEDSTAKSRR